MVDTAAESNGLPATFLTRVLWQESGFRTDVASPAGAAGVAQFMPQTAAERGLADPYDPGPALLQAARLLAELAGRFGNLGLAAAAYNAGAGRLSKWLHAQAGLPTETQLHVLAVTGHRVEEWRTRPGAAPTAAERGGCLAVTTDLARPATRFGSSRPVPACMAAWQVRLSCQGRPVAAAAPRNGPSFGQEPGGPGLVRSYTRDGYAVRRLRTLAFNSPAAVRVALWQKLRQLPSACRRGRGEGDVSTIGRIA